MLIKTILLIYFNKFLFNSIPCEHCSLFLCISLEFSLFYFFHCILKYELTIIQTLNLLFHFDNDFSDIETSVFSVSMREMHLI